MDLLPKPVFLPDTPKGVIKSIMNKIDFLYTCGITHEGKYGSPLEIQQGKQRLDDLILLGTSTLMTKVWGKLEKLELQRSNEGDIVPHSSTLTAAIYFSLYEESPWAALKPTEREIKHEKIIRTMRSLAEDIKTYELDQTEKVIGISNGGAYTYPDYDKPLKGNLGKDTNYRALYYDQTGIQISDLLNRHSDRLSQEKRHHDPLVTQSTEGEARRLLHFIRSLAIYHLDRYGKKHASIISDIAQVFFPYSETEPEKIRASIKHIK